jgi:very-short-patch-repair endonuclease
MPNKHFVLKFFKDRFSIDYDIITRLYKEQETIGQIIQVFGYKRYKTQFSVGSYRIDLYFPDDKLAIECDEFGHKDRCAEYETKREEFVRKELECKFIRYNPDSKNFSIFVIIREIVKKMSAEK